MANSRPQESGTILVKVRAYVRAAATAVFASGCVLLASCDYDSAARRASASREIDSLAERLERNPQDERALEVLLTHMRGKYHFATARALSVLGHLEVSEPYAREIATYLESPEHLVRKHAALSLAAMGQRSVDALPDLLAHIRSVSSRREKVVEDTDLFAIEAIANMGCLAKRAIPFLQSEVAIGIDSFDGAIRDTLRKLRDCK